VDRRRRQIADAAVQLFIENYIQAQTDIILGLFAGGGNYTPLSNQNSSIFDSYPAVEGNDKN
jgi:hypothetical protein